MAYGKFTGYEPAGIPGAYKFQTFEGKDYLFSGPEAETLRGRIDASSNLQPKVAGPGGGPVDYGPGVDPFTGKPYQGSAQPAAPVPLKNLEEGKPPASIARLPLDEENSLKSGGLKPFLVNGINTGYLQDESGQLFERTGGRAGITKEQLEERATQGVATPTAQSESVTGARPVNEEYLADRAIIGDVERDALETSRKSELEAEQAGRQVAQEQFLQQSSQLTEQRDLVNRIESEVAQAQQLRNDALKEYTGSKVDPDRIFQGGTGFAKRLTSAIAVAGGAYAATIGRTPNFALQIIDSQIARDIAAQEADIRIKKDKSDSALGDLMRKGMSLDQAKGTLATVQRDWAKQQMMLARGASQDDAINAKWDASIAAIDKKALDEEQKYRDDAMGTATKAVQASIAYPQAGAAGGVRPVAPGKALGIAGSTASTEGTIAGTAKTITEVQKEGAGGSKPLTNEQNKQIADIDASLAGLEEMEAMDRSLENPTIVTTGTFGSAASQKLGAAGEALAPGVARAIEGDAATAASMDAAKSGLLSTSGDRRKQAREEYKKQLTRKRQAIVEGSGE